MQRLLNIHTGCMYHGMGFPFGEGERERLLHSSRPAADFTRKPDDMKGLAWDGSNLDTARGK